MGDRWDRGLFIKLVIVLVVGGAFAAAVGMDRYVEPEKVVGVSSGSGNGQDHKAGSSSGTAVLEGAAEETRDWRQAENEFSLALDEPLVLVREQEAVLYVDQGILYKWVKGGVPEELYQWKEHGEASWWAWNGGILIGTTVLVDQQYPHGLWVNASWEDLRQEVTLASQITGPHPKEVLEVEVVPEQHLVLMKLPTENGGYYYSCFGGQKELGGCYWQRNDWVAHQDRVQTIPGPLPERNFHVTGYEATSLGGDVYSLGLPEGGAVFKVHNGKVVQVQSYVAHRTLGSVKMPSLVENEERVFVQLVDSQEQQWLASTADWLPPLSLEEKLLEPGWISVHESVFYRIGSDTIQTIAFTFYPTYKKFTNEVQLPAGSRISSSEDMVVTIQSKDEFKKLQLYDLMYYINPSYSAFELTSIEPNGSGQGEYYHPGERQLEEGDMRKVMLPKRPEAQPGWRSYPVAVQNKIQEMIYSGSGDYVLNIAHATDGNTFYFLADQMLSVLDVSGTIIAEAEVAVTLGSSVGNGVVRRGPKDLIVIEDELYLADTLGNRVLKVSAKSLKKEGEYLIPAPYKLEKGKANQIKVYSLSGGFILDQGLEPIRAFPLLPEKLTVEAIEERGLSDYDEMRYLEDKASGWVWFYEGLDQLIRFHPQTKEVYRVPVGYQHNSYGKARLFQTGSTIHLVFDHEAHQFNVNGEWLGVISYPRSEIPAVYDSTVSGEGYLILSQDQTKVYLVQGHRILEVDLVNRTHQVLFEQTFANIGGLALAEEKLWFTLQSQPDARYRENITSSELIALDLRNGKPRRYEVPGFAEYVEMESNRLKVWNSKNRRIMGIGEWMIYDLNQLLQ